MTEQKLLSWISFFPAENLFSMQKKNSTKDSVINDVFFEPKF